jgi:hypothetical protein
LKNGEADHFINVLTPFLKCNVSYSSHLFAERAALFSRHLNPTTENTIEVIAIGGSFFATFYSIVKVEKSPRNLGHSAMRNMFCRIHDEALHLLGVSSDSAFFVSFGLVGRRE